MRSTRPPPSIFVLALLALASLAGCKPKIGDKCTLSTDCSTQGERLCDTTQPDGYCTVFNCEPGRCPDEAVCVAFHQQADPDARCSDPQRWSRFERTFCMFRCGSDSDCRGGYTCAGAAQLQQSWGARVVDSPDDASVCVAEPTAAYSAPSASASADVCSPFPRSYGDIPYYNGGSSGAAGSGGESGSGGAGGEAGASGGSGGEAGASAGAGGEAGASGQAGAPSP